MEFNNELYEDMHFRQFLIIENDHDNRFYFEMLYMIFTLVMVNLIGFYISFYIIAHYIHPYDFNFEIKMLKKNIKTISFEEKYINQLKERKIRKLNDEDLTNLEKCVLIENTPSGNVIMLYNNYDESFWYFCDEKNISFKYLETVLRHYVIVYDCKLLYKNKEDELKKLYEKEEEEKREKKESMLMEKENKNVLKRKDAVSEDIENDKKEENVDSENDKNKKIITTTVFANFKKSRIKSNKKIKKFNNDKDDKVENNDKVENDKDDKVDNDDDTYKENKEHLVQANRFSYKGKIKDYDFIKKQLKENLPKLDFKTFMKIQKEKTEKNATEKNATEKNATEKNATDK